MPDFTCRLQSYSSKAVIIKGVAWRATGDALSKYNENVIEELTSPGVDGLRIKQRGKVPPIVTLQVVVPVDPVKYMSETERQLSAAKGTIVRVMLYEKPDGSILTGFNNTPYFLIDYSVVARGHKYHGAGEIASSTSTTIVLITLRWTGKDS